MKGLMGFESERAKVVFHTSFRPTCCPQCQRHSKHEIKLIHISSMIAV